VYFSYLALTIHAQVKWVIIRWTGLVGRGVGPIAAAWSEIPQHTGNGIDFSGRSFELTFDYGDQVYKDDNFAAFHFTNVGEGQKGSTVWHNSPDEIFWARGRVTQEEFLRSAKAVGSELLKNKGYTLGHNDCQHFTVKVLEKVGAPHLVHEAKRVMNGFGMELLQLKLCFLGLDILSHFSEGIRKLCGDGISKVTESCDDETTNYKVDHETVTQGTASCTL
jgi:hypothetical protein